MGLSSFLIHRLLYLLVQRLIQTLTLEPDILPPKWWVPESIARTERGSGVVFIPYSSTLVSCGPASDPNFNTAIRPPSFKGVGTGYRKAMLGAWLSGCLQSVPCPSMATAPPQKGPARVIKPGAGSVGGSHTPSIAFRHLPPDSARFSYATKGALFISAQPSSDAVSALRKVRLLI